MATQIKCASCGGALSIDDAACPFCGQVNELTKAHADARKTLEEKHDKAKAEASAQKILGRGVILAGAVLVALLIAILYTYSYEDHLYSNESKRRTQYAMENADSCIAQMDEYLAQEDYLTLHVFVASLEPDYLHSPYEPYLMTVRLCDTFFWLAEELMNIPYGSHEVIETYGEANRPNFERLGNLLFNFFERCDPESYRKDGYHTDEAMGLHHAKIMEEELYALLRTYLHASDAQIDSWRTFPATRIARETEELYDKEAP